MLVALLPTQVSEYWDLMKGDIETSLPPIADFGPYDMNNILFHMMTNRMTCWLYKDKEQKTLGYILTTILSDISGVRTLLIYSIIVLDGMAKVEWSKEFETLKVYAQASGCSKIGAFIVNEKILALLRDTEVDTRFVYAHVNV
jgi:hypothetical protein